MPDSTTSRSISSTGSRPERRRSRRRPRRGARARAGAPLLLRARGEAGDALHPCLGSRAGTAGRGARGLLRACRRPPDRRRLPLVRDGQLLPHRRSGRDLRAQHNLGLLARPRLPRARDRRGQHNRGAALRNTPKLAALSPAAGYDRRDRAARRGDQARERVMLGLRLDEPLPLEGLRPRSTQPVLLAPRSSAWRSTVARHSRSHRAVASSAAA